MKTQTFEYVTNCVQERSVSALNDMIDSARSVTWATIKKHCAGLQEFCADLGYTPGEELQIDTDWHVRFYKSKFKGRPCYYVDHSSIEYIFLETAR